MDFRERTIAIHIDERLCETCATHACVEACRVFARGLLQLVEGRPAVPEDQAVRERQGTECLACEHACLIRGNRALRIEVPIPGLEEYRRTASASVT